MMARRPRVWGVVIAANSVIMTLYLWHLTALLMAILAVPAVGIAIPHDVTGAWWAQRPLWVLGSAAILAPFVAVFARFERPRLSGGS